MSGTFPIPIAYASELSPRVTGRGGFRVQKVLNQDQWGTMCDDDPESMIRVFFSFLACSDDK